MSPIGYKQGKKDGYKQGKKDGNNQGMIQTHLFKDCNIGLVWVDAIQSHIAEYKNINIKPIMDKVARNLMDTYAVQHCDVTGEQESDHSFSDKSSRKYRLLTNSKTDRYLLR